MRRANLNWRERERERERAAQEIVELAVSRAELHRAFNLALVSRLSIVRLQLFVLRDVKGCFSAALFFAARTPTDAARSESAAPCAREKNLYRSSRIALLIVLCARAFPPRLPSPHASPSALPLPDKLLATERSRVTATKKFDDTIIRSLNVSIMCRSSWKLFDYLGTLDRVEYFKSYKSLKATRIFLYELILWKWDQKSRTFVENCSTY